MGSNEPILGAQVMGISHLFGQTRSALLALLYGRTDESFYLRQITRELAAGSGAVQRELKLLTDAGVITRKELGNLVFYKANQDSPVFADLKGLVTKTFGLHDVLRSALEPFKKRISLAFVYGSVARQEERSDSDIDLMVVGEVTYDDLVSALERPQNTLGREINPTLYGVREFREKMAAGSHFIQSVMRTRKVFIIGSENELRKVAGKRLAASAHDQRPGN